MKNLGLIGKLHWNHQTETLYPPLAEIVHSLPSNINISHTYYEERFKLLPLGLL